MSGQRELTRNGKVEALAVDNRVNQSRLDAVEASVVRLAAAMEKRVAALEQGIEGKFAMTEIHWPDGKVEILPRAAARQAVLNALAGEDKG